MNHALQRKLSLLVLAAVVLTASAAWSAGQVSGKYIGNGTPAKLTHAVIVPREPWSGETAYTIVLSEKDLTGINKPDVDALLGRAGHALVVNVTRKGDIFGSQICHQAIKKSGFSSSGTLFVDGFKIEGKQLSGRFYTKEKKEFFGDTWEIDLTVKAALP
jgi:hypothetical protein